MGTGRRWGNGYLFYHVKVRGNAFIQTVSPFEGTVTGSFMGGTHEGMAGVLKRQDLSGLWRGKIFAVAISAVRCPSRLP